MSISLDALAHIFSYLPPSTLLNTITLISPDIHALITYSDTSHAHLSNFIWKAALRDGYAYLPEDEETLRKILRERNWNYIQLWRYLLTTTIPVTLYEHEILTKGAMKGIRWIFGDKDDEEEDEESPEEDDEEFVRHLGKTLQVPLLKAIRAKAQALSEYDVVIDLGTQDVSITPTSDTTQFSLVLLNDDNTNITTVVQQVREATKLDIMGTLLKVHEAHHKGHSILCTTPNIDECNAMIDILRRVGLQTHIVDYTPNIYEQLYEIYARSQPAPESKHWTVKHNINGVLVIINTGNLGPSLADDLVKLNFTTPEHAHRIAHFVRQSSWCPITVGNFSEIAPVYQGIIDKKYSVIFQHNQNGDAWI